MSSDAAQLHTDEQRSALLERLQRGEISELTGSLESLSLAELIQTIESGRKDAQIRIDHDGEQSHVWCEAGQLIDARSGPLAGAAAVYRLFSLRHGRVYARFVRSERTRTIHASTAALLLEAAQRCDDCRELRERIGDTSAVYVASANAWAAEARLAPETWQMLRAFDGVSSVERVIATRNTPELESLTEIAGLLEQGLLMPRPVPTSPRWLPLSSEQTERELGSDAPPESSFRPFAASLGTRFTQRGPARRRLWLISAGAGAGVVALAFAVGFWSVRREVITQPPKRRAVASANDWANAAGTGRCPAGLVRIAGGPLFAAASSAAPAADGSRDPRIAPFCLGRTEVTVAEFESCVDAKACAAAERELDRRVIRVQAASPQCNSGLPGRESHPINCVDLQQAEHYCAWRGGRLPSQAEWEYAAQEVTADPQESHPGTMPVGTFPAGGNPEGVLDLLGNVSEWTTGRVGLRETAGSDDEPRHQLYAVLGGGLPPGASRLGSRAARSYLNANARGRNLGFRCAFDL
jgi:formylglycine-generating enzyme required for sulfatase activity